MKMESAMEEGDILSQEEESWNEELDISQLCRICANPNEYLIPIFQGEGLEHELEAKIAKHLPIKVSESDELPTNLCYQCASTLIAWHDMVVGCVEADEKLRAVTHYKTEKNIVTREQDTKLRTPVEIEKVAVEEEITSVVPGIIEEATPDTRCVKMEEDMAYYDDDSDVEIEDELMSELESDEDYGTLYNCNICRASNMALQDFLSHSKLHTKQEKQLALARVVNNKIVEEEAAKSAAATLGFRVQESLECSVTLYQCIVCGQGNLLLKNVREHGSIHPQHLESHFCNICQKQFPNHRSLTSHLEVHLDNNDLICQYCNKRFKTIYDLEVHEDHHYLAEYMCVDCRESFRSKELVLVHLRKFHAEDTSCLICDVKFKSDRVLNKHFLSHAIVHAVKKIIHFFTCDICGKKYDSKISLQRHKLFLHNSRLPFICELCGFSAYSENILEEHLEMEHSESEDRCICSKCENSNGTQPVEEIPIKNNVCKFCGLQFKLYIGLKQHLKSHGTVKNLNSFPKSNHSHEISKKELPYVCSCCGEIFTSEDLCVTHSTYHVDGVLCDLCGKSFKSEIMLKHHLNEVHVNKSHKHDEEKIVYPFRCSRCSLSFKLEFEFEEHCDIHKNVRYQCHVCFKEFTSDSELQDHLNCHDEEVHEND